jgi:hypothetical protein
MSDQRFVPPTAAEGTVRATGDCPRVAELINYALGRAAAGDCRRVEDHLRRGECEPCRRWLDGAARFRTEPVADAACPPAAAGLRSAVALQQRPAPGERTPLPESPRWQRLAFCDLEERLRRLEER